MAETLKPHEVEIDCMGTWKPGSDEHILGELPLDEAEFVVEDSGQITLRAPGHLGEATYEPMFWRRRAA